MKYVVEINSASDEILGLDYTVSAETAEEAKAIVFAMLPAGDWYINDVHGGAE